ncbi:MAG: hypothetical protein EXR68_03740 [Dehalococcoidia bacterium]|nr:hypothetical protein [Dehalococcoidia bacterium]
MTADPTAITLTFDDLFVLSTGGVDVFVYDMADSPAPPPYYITVDGRRFALSGLTFLEKGHGAVLPRWAREEEAAGRLVMFVRRSERLMGYVYDPAASDDDDEGDDE